MRFYLAVLLAFLVPFLLPVAIQAQQYQVGVSPSVIDIGDVSPGDSKVVKFYIVTASDIDLLVNLESQKGGIDFFVRDDYRDLIGEYSEQDASGWLNFVENPVELIPGEGQVKTKGGFITGWREVSFILNVPEYAEPGYHTITISPKPAASGGLGEQQVNIVAIVTTTVLFRVEGDATRNVEILDVVSGGNDGRRHHIKTIVKNTGTVTVSCRAESISISDSSRTATFISDLVSIRPGDTGILSTYVDVSELGRGEYHVDADVVCSTATASKQSRISLSGAAVAQSPSAPATSATGGFPIYLFAIPIAIVIGYIIYKRD